MEPVACLFVSFLANRITEDAWTLPAWVTAIQGKESATKDLFFSAWEKILVQRCLCLGLVGGHLLQEIRWIFPLLTICFFLMLPRSMFLLFPSLFCFSHSFMFWALPCPVTGDGSWMEVEIGHLLHTKLHLSLFCTCKVGLERNGQVLKATISNTWLMANNAKLLTCHKKHQER